MLSKWCTKGNCVCSNVIRKYFQLILAVSSKQSGKSFAFEICWQTWVLSTEMVENCGKQMLKLNMQQQLGWHIRPQLSWGLNQLILKKGTTGERIIISLMTPKCYWLDQLPWMDNWSWGHNSHREVYQIGQMHISSSSSNGVKISIS